MDNIIKGKVREVLGLKKDLVYVMKVNAALVSEPEWTEIQLWCYRIQREKNINIYPLFLQNPNGIEFVERMKPVGKTDAKELLEEGHEPKDTS